MTESFLHYLWKHSLYCFVQLKTTDGKTLKIIHPGYPHQDAGPDFKQAIIKINDMIWAGDVEIHLHSSDWFKHGHQDDLKYQSVVLHVVFEHDTDIPRSACELFPTLELKEYIPKKMLEEYLKLSLSENELPCKSQLHQINDLQFAALLSGKAMERLLNRQKMIFDIVNQCQGNWNEAFFRILTINFGFKTNSAAFELLGKSISFKHLLSHANARLQIYALIFGQAGMLEIETEDSYQKALFSEYQYLKYKYKLTSIHEKNWNYLRLRPKNFPCVRLAQLSELLFRSPDLFQKILLEENIENLSVLFSCKPHDYWQTHYHFSKISKKHDTSLGKNTTNLLLINTVSPILFAYATFHGNSDLQQRAFDILENIPFEENNITQFYKNAGFPAHKALYSQAILELKAHSCSKKKCLDCSIGSYIIKGNNNESTNC